MATPTTWGSVKHNKQRINSTILIMLVDSGALTQYLEQRVRPRNIIPTNYTELKQSHRIVTAGEHVVEDVATGTISGAVTD